jgi:outer membrane immunogenic protein
MMMKKILLAGTALATLVSGSAMAADLRPARAPIYTKAPMMAPAFSWTGCYVGGNAGGLWATKNWNVDATGAAQSSTTANGGLAGGQIGCNYQVSTWVFGIQGDYDWVSASGSSTDAVFAPAVDQSKIKALASVTGRAGYAMDRFLGYVKGGGAWVNDSYSVSSPLGANTASETRSGWTLGVGGEYAFTDWLTGFAEYDYYNFGTTTDTLTGPLGTATSNIKQNVSVAKAGVNFKFSAWH